MPTMHERLFHGFGDGTDLDVRARVEAVTPSGGWGSIVEVSNGYPTVLRRVKPETARTILWHAYVNTAVAAAVHLDRPIPESLQLPSIERFAKLDEKDGLVLDSLSSAPA